ncbi:autotransporter-associated beta strand repeat-containing protein [Manganibacter manganicus]|nr:autotransporter-associated beta strand repeat-containing protein [Pseudaminobacter manganicus]
MTKWKGEVASYAPNIAEIAAHLAGRSLALAVATGLAAGAAAAADRYWDPNGTAANRGGSGDWNLTSSSWSPSGDGVSGPYSGWDNNSLDRAFFGGTGGTVTLTSPITLGGITFDAAGYTLTGGTLNLAGSTPTIATLGNTTSASIESIIAGTSGLTKTGTGTLNLSGANTFTGDIFLNNGTLILNGDAALGAAANRIVTSNGTSLTSAGALAASRVVDLSGGLTDLSGAGVGSARFTGAGGIIAREDVSLTNDANDFTGQATLNVNGDAYFTSVGNIGEASSLGAGSAANEPVRFTARNQFVDSLHYIGDGDSSNRDWEFTYSGGTSGAVFLNNGTGALTLTGDISTNILADRLMVFAAQDADLNLLGEISSGTDVTMDFRGGGTNRTIALGEANTYSGATVVGTAGLGATGPVTVRAGALADTGVSSSFGTGAAGGITLLNGSVVSYTGSGSSSNRDWTIGGEGAPGGSILNDGSGALALSGAIDFEAVADNNLALGGSYGGTNTLSGIISGTGSLKSSGSGTWVLSGANTYTGAIVVDGGTLRAGNASAFGRTTGVTVNDGTLDLDGFDLTTPTLAGTGGTISLGSGTLSVDGDVDTSYAGVIAGSGGLASAGAGTLTLGGANSYTGDTSIGGGGLTLDFSASGAPATNIISSASTLNMAGGRLDLTGAGGATNSQSFDGLNITAGSNRIAATSGAGGSLSVDFGTITRTGGLVDFTLPTNGNFTTDSASLGGWATVNGSDYAKVVGGVITGFEAADYSAKDDAGNWLSGEVISDAGGAADTPFFGTLSGSQQLAGLKYAAAADSTVNIGAGQTVGVDGTIIVASSVGASNQTISGGSLAGATGSGTLGILQNGAGNFTIASEIVDNGGATGFTKGGSGLVTLTGTNSYTGVTTLSGGTLEIGSIANGGSASSIGASTADASNLVLESGALRYTGASTSTDRGFTLVNGGASRTIDVAAGGADLTFQGLVTGANDAGFTKAGAGTLTLANAGNDYAGVTMVSGGKLSVNTLADGGAASGIGAASNDSANIVLAGGTLDFTGGTTSTDRGFTLGAGGGGIGVEAAGTVLTMTGTAVGSGGLRKEGDGTLVLAGINTYTGTTVVNGGTLRAGSSQAFGSETNNILVNASGTLDLGGYDMTAGALRGAGTVDLGAATLTTSGGVGTFTGRMTGTGGFTRGADGFAQTMNGCNNDYTGATTIKGSLSVDCLADGGSDSSIGASSSDAANLVFENGTLGYTGDTVTTDRGFTLQEGNGTISVAQAATTLDFTGQVVGAGRLVKGGDGTLVLSGNNTYAGGTQLIGGILRANSSNAFGSLSGASFNGEAGILLDLNGFDAAFTYLNGGNAAGGDIALGGAILTIGGPIGSADFGGDITGNGSLVMKGANRQGLSGCGSDYTGSTTINSGTLEVKCLNDGGLASSIGASSADAGNLVLNGGRLSYIGTGSSTDRQLTLGASADSALVAGGTGAVSFTNTAPITFATANSAQTLRLTGDNTDDNSIAAEIADNGSGVTSLIKSGGGTWILTNSASTYTGVTTIEGGVLGVDKLADGGLASSLGASSADASNLIIGNGSTLRYTGTGDSTNRLFTLAAGTTVIESAGTGAIVFTDTGPVTLAGDDQNRTIALGGTNTGDNTLAGSIGDAGNGVTILAKNNSGTWVLTGNNTYSGTTVINDGTLVLGNGGTTGSILSDTINLGTFAFNRSDSYSYSGLISGSGGISQIGSGTTTLTSANSYKGTTSVTGGTLLINGDQSAATGLTSVASGGTLGGTGILGGDVDLTGGGTLTPGSNGVGELAINGDLALGSASILDYQFGQADVVGGPLNDLVSVGGDLTLDGTINVSVSPGGSFDIGLYRIASYDGALTDNGLTAGTIPSGGVVVDTSIDGQINLINTDGQLLNIWDGAAGPKFDGVINGGDGVWQSSAGNNNWVEATGELNAPYSDGSFAIFSAASGTVTIDSDLGAVSASGMQFASDGYRINGDPLTLAGPQATIRVGDGSTVGKGFSATIASQLTGASGLVKTDLGTLILTAANSYTGDTAIKGGTLSVSSDANLGAAGGALSLDGGTLQTTADLTTNRMVTFDGDGALLTDAGTTLTLDNTVSGSGALTKDGAGTLILAADGSYTGGTAITAGTLQLGDGGTGGVVGGDVVNDGTLAFNRSDSVAFGGMISGSGSVTQIGTGTTILTADNSYTGGTTIAGGTLQLGNGGTSGSIAGDVVNDGALAFNRSDELTFDGLISGSGSVDQIGTGTAILTAANSYAGATNVDAGTLLINGDQSAATGATGVASGAALGGIGIIGGSVTVVDGATLAPGSNGVGTLTINGDLSLAGDASTLAYDFGRSNVVGGPLNDLAEVGGDLTLDGTINVNLSPGGSFDAGIYRVISYGGALTDNGLDVGIMPAGSTSAVQTSVAGQVNLVNTAGLTLNFWDGDAGPKFDGAVDGGDGVWQNNTGNDDWTDIDGVVNAPYADDTFAVFSATSGTVTVDNSLGQVSASGLQFASDGYTITGDALELTGPQATIRVGDGTASGADYSAEIAAQLTGASELVKADLGTLILTGDNSYTGGTAVSNGTLLVNGDQSVASGLTSVGSATLGGTGIIGGDVTVAAGGTITPGSNGAGTLTINGNMTLDGGSTLAMEFGEANVEGGALNDLINVGGDLILDGTIDVAESVGGDFGAGVYRVINYGGALTDNGLDIGLMPNGSPAVVQTAIAGQVNLVTSSGMLMNFWDGEAGPKFDGVINGGDGVWQVAGGRNNWTDDAGALNAAYQNGGFAVFGGESGTVTIDNSLGQITASGMQFATNGYTITGDAVELVGAQATIRVGDGTVAGGNFTATIASELSGASELVKSDAGTLILAGTNSYSGGTSITGGTLQVAADTALGGKAGGLSFNGGALRTTADMTSDRSIGLTGDGTVLTDAATTFTWNGLLSGAGALTKDGAGTLVFTADNNGYSGSSQIKGGTLAVDGILGGEVDIAAGGRLEGNGQVDDVTNAGVMGPGRSIGTLTVAGDYVGDGGVLEIETTLGGDNSPTDLLVVEGDTSGTTAVNVINRGGLGAQTRDGIKIIDIGGDSDGSFALKGDYLFEGEQAVVAGAYGYRLYKNGIVDTADGDWYLRSTLLDPQEPGEPEPPLYQPGVPVYEGYAAAMQQLSKLGTMQQRIGNRVWGKRTRDDATNGAQGTDAKEDRGAAGNGVWARIEAAHADFKPAQSTSRATYDTSVWKLQTGVDGLLAENDAGRFIGGVFVQYGTVSSNVRSPYGIGGIDTTGYGLGATLTWYGQDGFYADAQAQVTWFDSDLSSATAGKRLVNGNNGIGYGLSIEAGQHIALSGAWSLTPQVQLAYSSVSFDDFTDAFGADVSLDRSQSLVGRFGMAANHDFEWRGANGQINRSHLYGIANLYYEFAGKSRVMVSDVSFASRNDRLYGGLGVGGTLNWADDKYAIYGEAQVNTSLENMGDNNAIGGSVGFRMRW